MCYDERYVMRILLVFREQEAVKRERETDKGGTREDVIHNRLDLCQDTIDEGLGEGCNHGAWLAMAW